MAKTRKRQTRRKTRRPAARAVITTIQIRTTAASAKTYRPKFSRARSKRSRR